MDEVQVQQGTLTQIYKVKTIEEDSQGQSLVSTRMYTPMQTVNTHADTSMHIFTGTLTCMHTRTHTQRTCTASIS